MSLTVPEIQPVQPPLPPILPTERNLTRPVRKRRRGQPEEPLTPEMAAYEEARHIANKRVGFFGHVVVWFMVVLFLGVASGELKAALILAFSWGIGLAAQGYYALVAPRLRKQYFEEEYHYLLKPGTEERRKIEGQHSRSLENLSASIAHEIRNPITAAKSLVQQMGEDPASEENIEYARVAIEELDRVEKSVSHLLRYAREDTSLHMEFVDMGDVIESALDTFKDRIERAQVTVDKDLNPESGLDGDSEKLRRVIINLVGNALDAIEETGTARPVLSVGLGRNLAGDELWVKIRDNGAGIPEERLTKIFSPFHTSKKNGTGLGLAITKRLVEAHCGTIGVHSEPGVGTEFEVVLPVKSSGEQHA